MKATLNYCKMTPEHSSARHTLLRKHTPTIAKCFLVFLQQSQKVKQSIFKHTLKENVLSSFSRTSFLPVSKSFSSSILRSTPKSVSLFITGTWAVPVSKYKSRADLSYPKNLYTIKHTWNFKTHSGCWNRKPNWKKKKAGRRADDRYTDSTECKSWITLNWFLKRE